MSKLKRWLLRPLEKRRIAKVRKTFLEQHSREVQRRKEAWIQKGPIAIQARQHELAQAMERLRERAKRSSASAETKRKMEYVQRELEYMDQMLVDAYYYLAKKRAGA